MAPPHDTSGSPAWLMTSLLPALNDLHRALGRLEATLQHKSDSNVAIVTHHIASLASHVDFRTSRLERAVTDVTGQIARFEQKHLPDLHRQIATLKTSTPRTPPPQLTETAPATPPTATDTPQSSPLKRIARKLFAEWGKDGLIWLAGRALTWIAPYVVPILLALWAWGTSVPKWIGMMWRMVAG